MEIIGDLKIEHRIMDLFLSNFADVLLWAHLIGILAVVGYPSAESNSFEVQLLAKFLAVIVQSSSQT